MLPKISFLLSFHIFFAPRYDPPLVFQGLFSFCGTINKKRLHILQSPFICKAKNPIQTVAQYLFGPTLLVSGLFCAFCLLKPIWQCLCTQALLQYSSTSRAKMPDCRSLLPHKALLSPLPLPRYHPKCLYPYLHHTQREYLSPTVCGC